MIRVERTALPEGLRALAYRDHDGSLVICVSEALDPASQRAAVIQAIRASRRTGWRAGLPLAGVAMVLAARARGAATLSARPAAWAAAATATAAAAAAGAYFLVTSPSPGAPVASQPGTVLPHHPSGPDRPRGAAPGGQRSPAPAVSGAPGHGTTVQNAEPAAAPQPPRNRQAPSPSPSAAGAPTPTPVPSQQPAPPATDRGLCLHLLGTTVCLEL